MCLNHIIFKKRFIFFSQNTTEEPGNEKKFLACIPSASPRGHTGYLTTATFLMETRLQPEEVVIEDACEK